MQRAPNAAPEHNHPTPVLLRGAAAVSTGFFTGIALTNLAAKGYYMINKLKPSIFVVDGFMNVGLNLFFSVKLAPHATKLETAIYFCSLVIGLAYGASQNIAEATQISEHAAAARTLAP